MTTRQRPGIRRPAPGTERIKLRYRYRIYPTRGQRQALAKAFGCARVVFNDAVAARREAYAAGRPYPTGAELSRRLITNAKKTPERAWLSEAPNVVLQQALRDADQAYWNFFKSLKGVRRGPQVNPPRFRSRKDSRQSIRFTRGNFSIRKSGKLNLGKIGEVPVRWSRELPSEPSSVTVIRDAAGRYFASFVVAVAPQPLPERSEEVGIDLGLASFAVLSNGTKIESPRYLQRAERRLRRAHRSLDRKQKGSRNREKARLRLARAYAKVTDARRDFSHKLSTRLIREYQRVYMEDLAVTTLRRTRRAKAINDAGWAQFVRMVEEKAGRYGRDFRRVSRFYASSQLCSACGRTNGMKPLHVRSWTCSCGVTHERDLNAAMNILAAGRADKPNACGGMVRPDRTSVRTARPEEAGTHRAAANAAGQESPSFERRGRQLMAAQTDALPRCGALDSTAPGTAEESVGQIGRLKLDYVSKAGQT